MNKFDLKRLAEDLLTLEVNTIISDEISAEKMPEKNRITLYNLATEYGACLIKRGKWYQDQLAKADLPTEYSTMDLRGKIEWPYGGMLSYDELRARAKAAAALLEQFLLYSNDKPALLSDALRQQVKQDIKAFENIESNCSRMVGMFKVKAKEVTGSVPSNADMLQGQSRKPQDPETPNVQPPYAPHLDSVKWNNDIGWDGINSQPDLSLKAYEITRLRKAWDIGTEQIVMQTTLTLDGDVTTRLQKQFADTPNQFVMDMHSSGINTSLSYWGDLMKILGSAFDHIGKFLSGKS